MGIASLTGRIGNMIAPFTTTVVGILQLRARQHTRSSFLFVADVGCL